MENVSFYIYYKIKELFDSYLYQGISDSTLKAERTLKSFFEKHHLKTDDLDDIIKKHICNSISEIYDNRTGAGLNAQEIDIRNKLLKTDDGVVIKSPKTTIEKIIKLGDENFYKKARYKIESIEKIFDIEIKNRKIDGKTIHCMIIPFSVLSEFD